MRNSNTKSKQKDALQENMEYLCMGLGGVIDEFAECYAGNLPVEEVRNKMVTAAAFAWLSEELCRCVQRYHGTNYNLAQPAEQANNLARIAYSGCVGELSGQIPFIPEIMKGQR